MKKLLFIILFLFSISGFSQSPLIGIAASSAAKDTTYGPELAVSFLTGGSGANYSISTDELTLDYNAGIAYYFKNYGASTFSASTQYQVSFEIVSIDGGSLSFRLDGSGSYVTKNTVGINSFIYTTGSTFSDDGRIQVGIFSDNIVVIKNMSVKLIILP